MQAPGQRDYIENLMAWSATLAGDLALAREIVERSSPDVVPPFAAGQLELLASDPSTAAATIERWRRVCVESGNAWTAMTYEYNIAQVQWALADPAVDETYRRITAAATASCGTRRRRSSTRPSRCRRAIRRAPRRCSTERSSCTTATARARSGASECCAGASRSRLHGDDDLPLASWTGERQRRLVREVGREEREIRRRPTARLARSSPLRGVT
jgi:hypothetical protein